MKVIRRKLRHLLKKRARITYIAIKCQLKHLAIPFGIELFQRCTPPGWASDQSSALSS